MYDLAIVGLVMRESPGNSWMALTGGILMLEHNRNLSSIVGTIQDEGPPAGEEDKPRGVNSEADPFDVESLISGRAVPQRSPWRLFSYILLATLVLAAILIFAAGGGDGRVDGVSSDTELLIQQQYLQPENDAFDPPERTTASVTGKSTMPVIVDVQSANISNVEIHERQSLIMQQLQELTNAIADTRASNNQYWTDNQAELKKLQEGLHSEIKNIAAAIAGLQQQPDVPAESSLHVAQDPTENNVALPEPGKVPVTGQWVVNVVSSEHLEAVEKLKSKLGNHQIPSEIQEVMINGKLRYRLRITGFTSSEEARQYARDLDDELGLKDPWIGKR